MQAVQLELRGRALIDAKSSRLYRGVNNASALTIGSVGLSWTLERTVATFDIKFAWPQSHAPDELLGRGDLL